MQFENILWLSFVELNLRIYTIPLKKVVFKAWIFILHFVADSLQTFILKCYFLLWVVHEFVDKWVHERVTSYGKIYYQINAVFL